MKYPGLAKSAQMYGGIGLTAAISLRTDNVQVLLAVGRLVDSNSGPGHWHNWQAVQTLTISVSLVNSYRLLICCASCIVEFLILLVSWHHLLL